MEIWMVGFASALVVVGCAAYWMGRRRTVVEHVAETGGSALPAKDLQAGSHTNELSVNALDRLGNEVFSCRELDTLPANAMVLASDASTLRFGRQLASDLFKTGATLPNRTVEIVFDPKIQQGLKEGALELVPAKAGGHYLDTRPTGGGQFAGKGRLLEGGRARQLVAGAFQLLSIAVAQSHLADISRGLDEVKDGLSVIRSELEHAERAQLTAAVDYLGDLFTLMQRLASPQEIPQEKRNVFEMIVKDAIAWTSKLSDDAVVVHQSILALVDADSVGTGHTHQRLLDRVSDMGKLVRKHRLLLQVKMLLSMCAAYMDPTDTTMSGASIRSDAGFVLSIHEISLALRDRSNQLLFKAVCNRGRTLEARRTEVIGGSQELVLAVDTQQVGFDSMMDQLKATLGRMSRDDGKVSLGLTFNAAGEVDKVLLL